MPNPTGQQQSNANAPEHDSEQKRDRGPIQVAIVSQVPPAPSASEKAANNQKTPPWKTILEFSALAVAVVAAVIYGCQLKVMSRQLGEMKSSGTQTDKLLCLYGRQLEQITKQANDTHDLALAARDEATASQGIATQAVTQAKQTTRLADDTKLLAKAAGEQADATQNLYRSSEKGVATAQDAIYQEQRPWVGIAVVTSPTTSAITAGGGVSVAGASIYAHNTGRTPALQWRYYCCERVTTRFDDAVSTYDTLKAGHAKGLSPTQQDFVRDHPEQLPKILEWNRNRDSEVDAYFGETSLVIPPNGTFDLPVAVSGAPGTGYEHVLGKMVYTDVIKGSVEHVTSFCLVSVDGGPLRLCKSGQDMN